MVASLATVTSPFTCAVTDRPGASGAVLQPACAHDTTYTAAVLTSVVGVGSPEHQEARIRVHARDPGHDQGWCREAVRYQEDAAQHSPGHLDHAENDLHPHEAADPRGKPHSHFHVDQPIKH